MVGRTAQRTRTPLVKQVAVLRPLLAGRQSVDAPQRIDFFIQRLDVKFAQFFLQSLVQFVQLGSNFFLVLFLLDGFVQVVHYSDGILQVAQGMVGSRLGLLQSVGILTLDFLSLALKSCRDVEDVSLMVFPLFFEIRLHFAKLLFS